MSDSFPWTGTIVRRGRDNGIEIVAIAVTLPDETWDTITEHLSEKRRLLTGNSAAPDIALQERIRMFLEDKIANWIAVDDFFRSEDCELDAVPF